MSFQFNPPDCTAFYEEHGWAKEEMRYLHEEAARLKRPLVQSRMVRFLMSLMPPARRKMMKQMTGYALMNRLEPGGL